MKKAECSFMQGLVEYLAHRIDADGLHTMPHKLEAIVKMPEPKNVQEVSWSLQLLLLHPFNQLMQQD